MAESGLTTASVMRYPWYNYEEFREVASGVLHCVEAESVQPWVLQRLASWHARGSEPLYVDSTYCMLELLRQHSQSASDGESVRLGMSMAIVRLVNMTTDTAEPGVSKTALCKNKKGRARSVLQRASDIGLPRDLVRIRHCATHADLPSLAALRDATCMALSFLIHNYWFPSLKINEASFIKPELHQFFLEGFRLIGIELSELSLPPPEQWAAQSGYWLARTRTKVPSILATLKEMMETKELRFQDCLENFLCEFLILRFDVVENPVVHLFVLYVIYRSTANNFCLRLQSRMLNFLVGRRFSAAPCNFGDPCNKSASISGLSVTETYLESSAKHSAFYCAMNAAWKNFIEGSPTNRSTVRKDSQNVKDARSKTLLYCVDTEEEHLKHQLMRVRVSNWMRCLSGSAPIAHNGSSEWYEARPCDVEESTSGKMENDQTESNENIFQSSELQINTTLALLLDCFAVEEGFSTCSTEDQLDGDRDCTQVQGVGCLGIGEFENSVNDAAVCQKSGKSSTDDSMSQEVCIVSDHHDDDCVPIIVVDPVGSPAATKTPSNPAGSPSSAPDVEILSPAPSPQSAGNIDGEHSKVCIPVENPDQVTDDVGLLNHIHTLSQKSHSVVDSHGSDAGAETQECAPCSAVYKHIDEIYLHDDQPVLQKTHTISASPPHTDQSRPSHSSITSSSSERKSDSNDFDSDFSVDSADADLLGCARTYCEMSVSKFAAHFLDSSPDVVRNLGELAVYLYRDMNLEGDECAKQSPEVIVADDDSGVDAGRELSEPATQELSSFFFGKRMVFKASSVGTLELGFYATAHIYSLLHSSASAVLTILARCSPPFVEEELPLSCRVEWRSLGDVFGPPANSLPQWPESESGFSMVPIEVKKSDSATSFNAVLHEVPQIGASSHRFLTAPYTEFGTRWCPFLLIPFETLSGTICPPAEKSQRSSN